MARIALREVLKRYTDEPVLRDCSLDINDREFIVLVGPSGSGKTTLIRIIAGLESVSEGDVYFDDIRVNDIDVGDRDVAMVFQNYGLYPHMSVYENMAFGLKRRKLPKPEIEQRVRETAELLGIVDFLARRPRNLSGGQRQRVALGRAIVRDPAVFLLDEPLSNLDAHLRVQMRAEILKVHRTVTATAVYVTHDQVEALTMGDRIVVMNEGQIHQVGTPDELYDSPLDTFVAGFIGTPRMGFVQCGVESIQGGARLRGKGVAITIPRERAAPILQDGIDEVTVGIRPERLTLVAPGDRAGEDSYLEGVVEVVELVGSEQHVHVDVSDQLVVAKLPRDRQVRIEENVTLATSGGHVHVFDPETGRALL